MKLLVLHISDLHAREGEDELCAGLARNIALAVSQCAREHDEVVVVFSGDIAWSGRVEEYEACARFFSELAIIRTSGDRPPLVVTTPGNHDLNFELEEAAHTACRLDARAAGYATEASWKKLSDLLAPYRQFRELIVTKPTSQRTVNGITALWYGAAIVVIDIDSATHAAKKCSAGEIVLPGDLDATLVALLSDTTADVRLATTHFPPAYYAEPSRRVLAAALGGRVDLVLTGHEHNAAAFLVSPVSGQEAGCIHLESGALRGSGGDAKTMRLISIDTAKRELRLVDVSAIGETASLTAVPPTVLPTRSGLSWTPARLLGDYRADIATLAVALRHKGKIDITLDDIFVYPSLKRNYSLSEERGEKDLKDNVVQLVIQHKRLIIQGAEKSGKTSLARRLVLDLLERGHCAVLLDSSELTSKTEAGWQAALLTAVRRAYGASGANDYQRTPPAQRYAILDAWPPAIKGHHLAPLLDYLQREFSGIVLMSSKDVMFELMMSADVDTQRVADALASYATYDLMRFGRVKRAELIERWFALGDDPALDPYIAAKKRQAAEKLVGDLMGRFVPSWPLYVLLVLQTMESAQPLSVGATSHGSLYEALIKGALFDALGQASEVDAVFHFLAFVAGQLKGGDATVRVQALRSWHATYTGEQFIARDFEKDLQALRRARVLVQAGGDLKFAYDYIELYFRALHMAGRLREPTDDTVQAEVRDLISKLYHTQTANLVLFLAYLDQSRYVMESLLSFADTIYVGVSEFDMGTGVPALDSLARFLPLALNKATPESNRRQQLAEADAAEDVDTEDPEMEGRADDEYRQIQDLSSSYRTIQIIGQIIRVFPGSVAGKHRLRLARASVSLALRTLSFMMASASQSRQFVLERLRNVIRKQYPDALPAEISVHAEAVLYGVCEGLAFSVVKHAGAAVSLPSLKPLHEAMKGFHSPPTSLGVLMLSIALDAYDEFPRGEIVAAFRNADKAKLMLTADVIRHLAWQHMHTFSIDYRDRQAVCGPLRIKSDVRMIATDDQPR